MTLLSNIMKSCFGSGAHKGSDENHLALRYYIYYICIYIYIIYICVYVYISKLPLSGSFG